MKLPGLPIFFIFFLYCGSIESCSLRQQSKVNQDLWWFVLWTPTPWSPSSSNTPSTWIYLSSITEKGVKMALKQVDLFSLCQILHQWYTLEEPPICSLEATLQTPPCMCLCESVCPKCFLWCRWTIDATLANEKK